LPIFPESNLEQALHGGEDYELLFTAAPRTKIPFAIAGIPTTRIGRITKRRVGKPLVVLIDESGRQPLERRGWEHFA
jgi:thiamine-monophosphate kinase